MCVFVFVTQRASLAKQASLHSPITFTSQAKVAAWLQCSDDMDRCSKGVYLCKHTCTAYSDSDKAMPAHISLFCSCLYAACTHPSPTLSLSLSVFLLLSPSFLSLFLLLSPALSLPLTTELSECEAQLLELNHLLRSMEVLHRTYSAPAINALQVLFFISHQRKPQSLLFISQELLCV